MRNSLWRQPYLVELTQAENFHLVKSSIKGHALRILDVGCGTGFMCLELARMGHEVLGIDSNERIIRLARRTMETDPYRNSRGGLRYQVADFNNWSDTSSSYDVVLLSRILHDLPHPGRIVSKAHRLLKKRGGLVCLEYAYDQVNRRTAIWLYQTRRALEASAWYPPPHLPEDPRSGVEQILNGPLANRKEHINTFEEMRRPLDQFFERKRFSWHCYHCWDILTDMRIPDREKEKAVAAHIKRMEQFLIDTGEIQPVLFRFVGTKSSSPSKF